MSTYHKPLPPQREGTPEQAADITRMVTIDRECREYVELAVKHHDLLSDPELWDWVNRIVKEARDAKH